MEQVRAPQVEDHLRELIHGELLEEPFDGDDPLAAGVVDSLGIEQLIEYVFEAWGVELGDEDIVEENFESLTALAALVEVKSRRASAARGAR
jgi:acyl carrier protein